jgi:aminopeptidase N
MRVLFFLLLSLNAYALPLEYKLAHLGSDRIDVLHYDLKFVIPKLGKSFDATATIKIKSLKDFSEFGLHTDRQRIKIKNVSGKNLLSYKVISGIKGDHGLNGDILKVKLRKKMIKNSAFTIVVNYHVNSNSFGDEKGFIYRSNYKGSELLNVRSWPYYSRFWMPGNDHPGDVATFDFELQVPLNFSAVANGVKVGETLLSSGLKSYKYSQRTPIPTYGTNLVVGDFRTDSEMICYDLGELTNETTNCNKAQYKVPLNYYYPNYVDFNAFKGQILKSSQALIFYSNLFHNYAFDNLSFVTAPHPFNMESVNLITLVSPDAAVHEVLHMWWGNTVFFKHWGDFWISEGLTTYFTGYYDEYINGKNSSCLKESGQLNHGPETDPMDIFDDVPYCKGAATIDGLRSTIASLMILEKGTKVEREFFNKVMNHFYNKYRFKKIDSKDFINYFQTNLVSLSQGKLSQVKVDLAINKWKYKWFSNL